MTTSADELPTDLETCHQLIRELVEILRRQTSLNEKLQHQLERLLRRVYGPRAERIDPGQLLLLAREVLEVGGAPPVAGPGPTGASAGAPPRKGGHGRKPLPAHLARRRIVHDVPAEQRACPDCGAERSHALRRY